MPERRRRAEEGGQMMLLSAVLLIFAFLALSAMVARVAQLGSLTTQDQGRPILLEIDIVQDVVDDIILDLKGSQLGAPPPNATYDLALNNSLSHLAFLEGARGFHFDWEFTSCLGTGASTARQIDFRLSDGEIQIELRSTQTFTTAGCRPPP